MPVVNVSNLLCSVCAPVGATTDGSGFLLPPQSNYPATALLSEAVLHAGPVPAPSALLWQMYLSGTQPLQQFDVAPKEPPEQQAPEATMELPLLRVEEPVPGAVIPAIAPEEKKPEEAEKPQEQQAPCSLTGRRARSLPTTMS
jgi:hypothetical protein